MHAAFVASSSSAMDTSRAGSNGNSSKVNNRGQQNHNSRQNNNRNSKGKNSNAHISQTASSSKDMPIGFGL